MIKNYLKTAFRNLLRYKGFSLINILGLSIALTGCLVIGLFVRDEWQYDKFVTGGENIYRFYTKRTDNSGATSTASVPPMFATYMQQHYPEVENTARILMRSGKVLFEVNDIKAYEEKGIIADSTFFKLFPLKFLEGNPETALNDPNSVVITKDLAEKYFGKIDALDKTIRIDNTDCIVKGVLDNIPEHFHLDFTHILPIGSDPSERERMKSWNWQQFFTYIKIKPGTDVARLQSKFQEAVKNEVEPKTKKNGFVYVPFLQSLADIHLKSADFVYDNAKRGNATYVKGLSVIAIFVLLIACFNFINLATARSFRRAKEIGVRKVIGAERRQLILQFTGETILLSVIAGMIAAIATMFLIPALNNFTGKSISFNPFLNPVLGIFLLGFSFIIGILAGIYPALVMSGFKPIKVLKGFKVTSGVKGSSAVLRQGLVVVQFALSALLIISTLTVYRQLNFLHKTDLGFNKDQVIYFRVHGDVVKHPEEFKTELLRSPEIVSATIGYGLPGDIFAGDRIKIPGKDGERSETTDLFITDYDYIKTLRLQVVAGRDFSREHTTDAESGFIINETAVREFGFGIPEKALGQPISWDKWERDSTNPVKKGTVIGVVKDYHYKSLHEKISKAVLIMYPDYFSKVAVKLKTADLAKTIAYIKTIWDKFSPKHPLDYNFLDENFEKMYKSEEKLSGLLWIFTAMAIFVGCMGLFGLAAFSAEQRVKEIGIRKILGANTGNIVTLLSGNFIALIILSLVIASPVAWWFMNKWLQDFPYRVNVSWGVFVLAGIAALVVAMLTISFQAIKAAVANPVKSLRTE
jgi:putative ABC transport system permease protein